MMQWQQEWKGESGMEREGRMNRTKRLNIGGKGEGESRMILSFESKLDSSNWTKKSGLETR